jgi:FAD/FMN-containing dehydrogenase
MIIYDIVASLGGTFSAEHGIGRTKIGLLEKNRCSIEIDLMRQIKVALDNDYLMNPDKIFCRPVRQ